MMTSLENASTFIVIRFYKLGHLLFKAIWLKKTGQTGFKNYERMIFISPNTWQANSKDSPWAEFIPVDQTLGGLNSDYLRSVMIHELNVNSPNFLATDTHGLHSET
jgi:hypothetical protein